MDHALRKATKESELQCLGAISKTDWSEWSVNDWQNNLSSIPRQAIPYDSNISLWPNHNTKEAEVEQFYEDLQDLLELTSKKDVLFIIGDWNAKERKEAGQRL